MDYPSFLRQMNESRAWRAAGESSGAWVLGFLTAFGLVAVVLLPWVLG